MIQFSRLVNSIVPGAGNVAPKVDPANERHTPSGQLREMNPESRNWKQAPKTVVSLQKRMILTKMVPKISLKRHQVPKCFCSFCSYFRDPRKDLFRKNFWNILHATL